MIIDLFIRFHPCWWLCW